MSRKWQNLFSENKNPRFEDINPRNGTLFEPMVTFLHF